MQKNISANGLGMGDALRESLPAASGTTLVDLMRVLRVRRKIIIAVAAVTVVLVTAIVMQLTPLYTATAVVLLDQRRNAIDTGDSSLAALPADQPTIQNQVQILNSLELSGRVVDKLHLDRDPYFNPRIGGLARVWEAINPLHWLPGRSNTEAVVEGITPERSVILHRFLGGLTAVPIGLSTAISISFQSDDPAKSAKIADALADAYVEDQMEAKFQSAQKATQWLSGRIQELAKQAETADAAVQRYKADHHISTSNNGVSVVGQQMTDITSQLAIAKANLAEKQAAYNSLLSQERSGQAASSSRVLSSPLIANLRAQETDLNRQLAQLSTKYLPGHPKILDIKAQQDNLQAKIQEEVGRVIESVRSEAQAAGAHVASLQQSLAELETQGAGQDQSSVQLTALQSTSTSTRSMYEAFLGRLSQTQDRAGIQAPEARVISNAEIPNSPSFPKRFISIAVSIPAGLLLGLLLAFMAERMDTGFRTPAQLESLVGVPVIGVVPEMQPGEGKSSAADLIADKPTSAFSEAIRGLHLGLSLSNIDRQPKVVVVTSSVPGEGKTTVAVSLARVAAGSGLKTVVIDCDMRRPAANKLVQQDYAAGLVEALTGAMPLDECFTKDLKSDALILPCLSVPPNPADLLASQAMRTLIARLREVFDFVVIDSPPILPVNDSKILSQLADAVLFVVRWEKTPREAVANSLRALFDVHAPISGVALTRADSERFNYYSYGYQDYQAYNKYYSN